jgi:pilus assembly protein CpaE
MNLAFSVLLVGRDKKELVALERVLHENTDYKVNVSVVTNGHFDPLHGINVAPDLIITCLSEAWQDELQQLADRPPATRPPVIVITKPSDDMQHMRLAMQAGARDFITRPVNLDVFLKSVNKVADEKTAASGTGPLLTAFVNAKGGSGATLLAANVAHVMAKKGRQKVALVDLDFQFGTLGLYLDIHPSMGIAEALEYTDQLDAIALNAYMANHESGVQILASTLNNVVLQREINIDRLNRLLTTMQSTFDHVIVDLPRQVDLPTTTIVERADHVVITTQQGLTHLRDAKRLLGILRDEMGIDKRRIMAVVNRYDAKAAIRLDDVRKMLRDITIETIPNDFKRVTENINLGIPLYKQSHTAPITKAVIQLAARLSNKDMTVEKQGLLSRMMGRNPTIRRIDA